jgi:hypothetical protein
MAPEIFDLDSIRLRRPKLSDADAVATVDSQGLGHL